MGQGDRVKFHRRAAQEGKSIQEEGCVVEQSEIESQGNKTGGGGRWGEGIGLGVKQMKVREKRGGRGEKTDYYFPISLWVVVVLRLIKEADIF